MNNENNLKKYFLKDSELKSIEEDKLNQKDIVNNLNVIIDNTKPPFNLALIGKWGSGKSSIINLLLSKYKNDTENYNIEKINVWKEKSSLKSILDNKFNKGKNQIKNSVSDVINETNTINENVAQNLNNASNIYEENNENVKTTENKNNASKTSNIIMSICNAVIIFMASLFVTSIIFILLEYFQNMSIYNANRTFFVENVYLNYCESLGAILIFTLILTIAGILLTRAGNKGKKKDNTNNLGNYKTTVSQNVQNTQKVQFVPYTRNTQNTQTSEQSDNNMENTNINIAEIEDVISDIEDNSNKTNIIIIEDIDKLSASKMLATLEEIKHCNEYENCICIVPFDATIVKKAIEARQALKINANYKPVNFELILDKIFQFKVHVPHICCKGVKDYAIALAQENIPNFIDEYCSISEFEKIVRYVLIYKNVTTPRHVKKLINNFVNNKILASYRIEQGKIDEEIVNAKDFNLLLAKISVIQADFYDFYMVLFKDANYLNELTELYSLDIEELKEKYASVDENLKPFLTSKYKGLRNFLKQTKRFEFEDVETFIYLTKVETEKMFGDKSVFAYIKGDEDVSELSMNDISKLIQLIDKKSDLKEFTANNYSKIMESYINNVDNKDNLVAANEIVNKVYDYIDEDDYFNYLEIVANNYNCYPNEALEVFKNVKVEIPGSIMVVLFERIKENLSRENYDDSFKVLSENSESFYEENGNVSNYVQFLVNNIALASDPNVVIEELDLNFTRIGRIYELNRNIKGLDNLNLDKAYSFMAKCLDNGDLDRMVLVINAILSDEDMKVATNNDADSVVSNESENALINDCLNIEARMSNYNLIDVVEYNVDSINSDKIQEQEQAQVQENAQEAAQLSYVLLKNLIEISAIKQNILNPVDVMVLVEKALTNVDDLEYLYNVYSILRKFDRMYFYEIRRDFNDIIYASFHSAKKNLIKEEALECARYFKTTRLFKTKLTKAEEKFYNEN